MIYALNVFNIVSARKNLCREYCTKDYIWTLYEPWNIKAWVQEQYKYEVNFLWITSITFFCDCLLWR